MTFVDYMVASAMAIATMPAIDFFAFSLKSGSRKALFPMGAWLLSHAVFAVGALWFLDKLFYQSF